MKARLPAVAAIVLFCVGHLLALDSTAENLMSAGHFKRAGAIAQRRLAANSNDADALYILGRVQMVQGNLDQAEALLQRAIAINGNVSDYHRVMGMTLGLKALKANLLSAVGIARRAKKEAELAYTLNSHSVDAIEFLAQYYDAAPIVAGGSHQKAEQMVQSLLQLDRVRGLLAQAEGARSRKDAQAEESLLLQAAQADASRYEPRDRLAGFYLEEQHRDLGKSERYAREALHLDPSRAGAYSILGSVMAVQGRWPDLDALLAQAEKNVPDDLAPFYEAGTVLVSTGSDVSRAERYLRKYLSQEPEGNEPRLGHAHWQLGLALLKQGRKALAVSELQISVDLMPGFRPAADDLRKAQAS